MKNININNITTNRKKDQKLRGKQNKSTMTGKKEKRSKRNKQENNNDRGCVIKRHRLTLTCKRCRELQFVLNKREDLCLQMYIPFFRNSIFLPR